MADLRDRIADALYTAPADPTEAGELVARRTAEHDADAVMEVVAPEIAHWRTEAADGAAMAKRRGELVRELKTELARVRALADEWTDITIGPATLDRDKWLAIAGDNIMHVLDGQGQSAAERLAARVRELHPTREVPAIHSENPTAARAAYTECATCFQPYPCPTIREINGSTSE